MGGSVLSKVRLTQEDFDWFRELIAREAGINIANNKHQFVYNRVIRRMQYLGINSFEEYKKYISLSGDKEEIEKLLEEIVTHETSFFRYRPHFEYFERVILKELVSKRAKRGMRSNILSAGCSTGEELYSLAIIIYEKVSPENRVLFRLNGFDISRSVIERAREGTFLESELEELPENYIKNYFVREGNVFRLIPQVQANVNFYKFNMLHDSWHHFSHSDVIFCRNTLIYLTKVAKEKVLQNVVGALRDGGYLVLGHTEIIDAESFGLTRVANTIYRKVRK